VLIDGRTVYTPLFSGVHWDAHDVVMEDIDRIEVIRGPVSSLWGANAVNGVINVITKKTQDTEGFLVRAAAGSQEGHGAVRYGGKGGENMSYRIFARYSNRDSYVTAGGAPAFDAWDMFTGGFRMDWTKERDSFVLLGSAYDGKLETGLNNVTFEPPFTKVELSENSTSGLNVLAGWSHSFGVGNDLVLQGYYDRYERDEPAFYVETRDTFDIDLQHGFVAGRHDVMWGGVIVTRRMISRRWAL